MGASTDRGVLRKETRVKTGGYNDKMNQQTKLDGTIQVVRNQEQLIRYVPPVDTISLEIMYCM